MTQLRLWTTRSVWTVLVALLLSQAGCLMFKSLPDRPADAVSVMPLPTDENFAHWGQVGSIRFADDGAQVISVGAQDGMIKRWDWRHDDLLTM